MKVVVAHNQYSSAAPSGENVIVDAEIAQLRAAGVEVVPFLRSSDEIGSLPLAQKALLPVAPIWSPAAQRSLAALIRAERPDLLHLHNPYPLLSPGIVRTAHAHGLPVLQTVHNYRQVCAPGLYFRDGHICHDCRGRAFALPAIRHSCYRGSKAQSAIMATSLAVNRRTWHSVDHYLALTGGIADHLRDYGIPDERITVKPNALADPGTPVPVGSGFLFASRLSAEKGLQLLLDAWSRHPVGSLGVLRVASDGPLRPVVEAAAAARSDVVYLGPQNQAGVRAAMRESAVVVAASTWDDVLPTVIIEALSNGRPVLGTALGGIPYLIGDAGWTVAPSVDELAAALPVAAAGAAGLSAAARARYEANFTPDVLMKRLLAVYSGLVNGGRREEVQPVNRYPSGPWATPQP
ncbi:glycosyltransferase family 4 protein [Rugosimonospora acidiphila]|uniref:Glycosyltransferase family 4 protein n=1 Tax=Rugosimonospora acidiphila TaxID=556531 RepID=A0ABP9S1A5_9ACTN